MLIKDLSLELDSKTMTAVRGGDYGNANVGTIGQLMSVQTPVVVGTGAGSALNNSVNVTATQDASIHTDQYAGDAFSFLAGIYGGLRRA